MKNSIDSENRYAPAPRSIARAIQDSVQIPDDFPAPEELRRDLKKTVTLRLDPDVYRWFKQAGAGYQTRINAVLRAYMLAMRREHDHSTAGNELGPVPSAPTTRSRATAAKDSSREVKRRRSK